MPLKEFVTGVPTINEEQILPQIYSSKNCRSADMDDALIWGISGPRGSGKSETLDFLGVRTLAMGLPVWSNFPIKYKLRKRNGDIVTLQSTPLMFKDLFALSDTFKGGLILIDEYQDWANAYSFMTMQNKLLSGFWAQIRKSQLAFAYGAKKLRWIDVKTREETDIEVACEDANKTTEGWIKYKPGEMIYWHIKDLSGQWTGKMYEDYPIEREKKFFARPLWGSYDTNQHFDIFEALSGVKLDLEKTVISNKDEQLNLELIEKQVKAMFVNEDAIKATEIYATLGLKAHAQKQIVTQLLKDIGFIEKIINAKGGRCFVKPIAEMTEV